MSNRIVELGFMSHQGLDKKFRRAVRGNATKVTTLANDISLDFDVETIHKFRTTVKQLRALLRWQGLAKDVFTLPFKKVYRAAGRIRDAQVLLAKTETMIDTPVGLNDWLVTQIKAAEKTWITIYDATWVALWSEELRDKEIIMRNRTTMDLYNKLVKRLRQAADGRRITDTALHDLRKKVKDVLIVLTWYKKHGGRDKKLRSKLKTLDQLAEKAGEYMDAFSALRLINLYTRQEKDDRAVQPAYVLRVSLQKEKRRLRVEWIGQVRAFIGYDNKENISRAPLRRAR
ncbi:MAG: CHAD domain-containing protein [Chitinophagaceae bacterium]|nr:CHAD domain-containing protein [Chitinophagaceae bacterium]